MNRLAAVALTALAALPLGAGAGCGGRGAFDARAAVTRCGLTCAADEARFHLAKHPRDRDVWVALAMLEEELGRPGAAIAAFEQAERLGRAFRGGLGKAEAWQLGVLLVQRAERRTLWRGAGSPGADTDVARARQLGAQVYPELVRRAALAAIAADLRHTDPDRRARGRKRLLLVDATRAAALAGDGDVEAIADTVRWLAAARAQRVVKEMLDERVRRHGVEALGTAARDWLEARRWWGGREAAPDSVTLGRVLARDEDARCTFPTAGCDVIAAAASAVDDGITWERALFDHWERDGIQAATPDEAAAWMMVARRAVARGRIASYERAVRDHVDVAAFATDPRTPAWARAELARIAAQEPAPLPEVLPDVVLERLLGASWPEAAAALVAEHNTLDGQPVVTSEELVDVAQAYAVDPALADRRAEDAIARRVDVAEVAPVMAQLFGLLGDPARARRLLQRAADANPEDAALALALAVAMADAGDPAAGLVQMIRAAAASGDAGQAMLHGAHGFAAAGHPVEALTLVRSAISLAAPGDEAPAAALAARLLDELGRTADAAALRALAPIPSAWDGTDERLAVEEARADARAGGARRLVALGRLAMLVSHPALDVSRPGGSHLAGGALRELLGGQDARAGTKVR